MTPPPVMPPAWERSAEVGPLTGFFTTFTDILRAPAAFFSSLPADGPAAPALIFWALTTLPPLVVSGLEGYSFLNEMLDIVMTAPRPGVLELPWWIFGIVAPLVQFASLLSGLAAVHIILALLGRARGGWRGTFRAGGYASAPALLGFIPLIGTLIAGLGTMMLQYLALRRIHAAPAWAVLLAYLIPVIAVLLIGAGIMLIIIALVAPSVLGLPG